MDGSEKRDFLLLKKGAKRKPKEKEGSWVEGKYHLRMLNRGSQEDNISYLRIGRLFFQITKLSYKRRREISSFTVEETEKKNACR